MTASSSLNPVERILFWSAVTVGAVVIVVRLGIVLFLSLHR